MRFIPFVNMNGNNMDPDPNSCLKTQIVFPYLSGSTYPENLLCTNDNKILASHAGFFEVSRFNSVGVYDSSFVWNNGTVPNTIVTTSGNFGTGIKKVKNSDKLYVYGQISGYTENAASDLIRLNSNGSLDTSFGGFTFGIVTATGEIKQITDIYEYDDGKILVSGCFNRFNGNTVGDSLIRLNSDGSLDTSFSGITSGFTRTASNVAQVNAINLQSDGKIIAIGNFTKYNGTTLGGTGIARLNSDGSLDSSSEFVTGNTFNINTIAFTLGNKILVLNDDSLILNQGASPFSNPTYSGITLQNQIIKLSSSGYLDTTFNTNIGTKILFVTDMLLDTDNTILFTGGYSGSTTNFTNQIRRINTDGTLIHQNNLFQVSGSSAYISYAVIVDKFGSVYIGGWNLSYNSGQYVLNFYKLNNDLTINLCIE